MSGVVVDKPVSVEGDFGAKVVVEQPMALAVNHRSEAPTLVLHS